MKVICLLFTVMLLSFGAQQESLLERYLANRAALLEKSREMWPGSNQLTFKERIFNQYFLLKLVDRCLSKFDGNPGQYHFYDVKDTYKECELYQVIQRMPKGVVQHIHFPASVDIDKEVQTFEDNRLWIDMKTFELRMNFSRPEPRFTRYLKELEFDPDLKNKIKNRMYLNYEDINLPSQKSWQLFNKIFDITIPYQRYIETFLKVLGISLLDLVDDNIQRVEFRHGFGVSFNDDGPISVVQEAHYIDEYIKNFNRQLISQNKNPIQVAFINNQAKSLTREQIQITIEESFLMRSKFPNLVIGFDLVGEEETLPQVVTFADLLVQIQEMEKQYGIDLPLYLHGNQFLFVAGETMDIYSENVYDALTLNGVKRIGHGTVLSKHPYLVDQVIAKNIGVEVCPISNQILGYVKDIRTHPAVNLLNKGVKVTINPDDPSCFYYNGVSFDWMSALLSWQLDLAGLKTLVFNSIETTNLNPNDKKILEDLVKNKWNQWINEFRTI